MKNNPEFPVIHSRIWPSRAWSKAGLVVLATIAVLLWPGSGHRTFAAGVTFTLPATITGDSDVYGYGSLRYAYHMGSNGATVNGVPFTAQSSQTSLGGGNVTMSGNGGRNATAFGSASGSPWSTLSAAYQDILRGGVYTTASGGPPVTYTLNNLAAGRHYVVQFWVQDNRSSCCFNRYETVTGGDNTVTLYYNNTKTAGGVGQYTLGYFTATGASQSFVADGDEPAGAASTQMNAIQLRDVSNIGYWNGQASGTWDGASLNFCQNLDTALLSPAGFDTVKSIIPRVYFADGYYDEGFLSAVTQNILTIPVGGVTGADVFFLNNELGYTISSSDSIGISGAYGISVDGGGSVTLNGTHTYTGPTTVSAGTLHLNGTSTLPGLVTVNAGATLNLSGNNALTGGLIHPGSVTGPVTVGGSLVGAGSLEGAVTLLPGTSVGVGDAPGNVATVAVGDLTLQGPTTLNFDLGATATTGGGVNDLIQVTGGFTNTGTVTVNFNVTAGRPALNTPYTLVASGALDPAFDPGNFVASSYIPAVFSVSGNDIQVTFTARTYDLIWQGDPANNTNWANGTLGWTNMAGDGTLDAFYNLDNVTFDDTALNLVVNLPGPVYPGSVTVNGAVNHYTFTGAGSIAGATGLTKDGAGSLTIAGANTYAGGTVVRAGTVIVGHISALGTGAASVLPSGTLELNSVGNNTYATAISGAGLLRLNLSGGVSNTRVNDIAGFTGTIELTNAVPTGTGNKWNATGVGATDADLVIRSGNQIFIPANITPSFRSIAVVGTGNTENRGAIRIVGTLGGPISLMGDTAIGAEGGTITGDISSGAPGAQILTVGTGSSAGNATLSGVIGGGTGTIGLTKIRASTLTLAGANTYTGPTMINEGTVVVTASGSIGNTVAINLAAGTVLDAAAAGGLSLGTSQTLSGSGSVSGQVSAGAGSRIVPGGGTIGTLTLNNNLSLSDVGALDYQLGNTTTEGAGVNDLLQVNGDLVLTGVSTVRIAFAGTPAIGQPYTLISYTGALIGGAPNLTVFNDTRLSFVLDFSVANKIRLIATGSTGNLIWVGGNPGNSWDTKITANWDSGMGPDFFYSGDTVRFENGSSYPTVNLVGVVQPANVNMVADDNYLFEGSGKISGGSLNKTGSGTLILANHEVNVFAAGTFVTGGRLHIGNGGTAGTLPEGPVVVDTAVVVNRSDDLTVSNAVAGTGVVHKQAANTLTLAAASSYSGGTIIEAGTLKVGNDQALGDPASAITTVSNGATLDIRNQLLWNYANAIVLNGGGASPDAGALTKSEPILNGANHIRSILLGSDATIGGVAGARIDIGRGDWGNNTVNPPIHIDGQGHTLSLVGSIYFGILAGAQNLAGFTINSGTLAAPHGDNSFGEAVVTLNGGTLSPWGADHIIPNSLVINSGYINNQTFYNTYTGPVQVNGPVEITVNPNGNIAVNGNISGTGSITKRGAFSLLFGGDNSGFSGSLTNDQSNTFFTAETAGSAAAAWVLNEGNLANSLAGNVAIQLGSLAGDGGRLANHLAHPDSGQVTFVIGANNSSTVFAGPILDTLYQAGTVAIVKAGTGTLTLTGDNAYTGGTSIREGTLEVGTLASLGTVPAGLEISAGAVARLSYGGSITVAYLTLDGVPQAGGTWGGSGSGATHVDDVHFQGTGVLRVPMPLEIPSGGLVVTGGGQPTAAITFDTELGFEYRVVYTESLTAPITWTEVPPGWQAGTGNPLTVTDDISGAVQRFYRIERRP